MVIKVLNLIEWQKELSADKQLVKITYIVNRRNIYLIASIRKEKLPMYRPALNNWTKLVNQLSS